MVLMMTVTGASAEAQMVADVTREEIERFTRSAFFSRPDAKRELIELHETCELPNWDGYGANAIQLETIKIATDFLAALPFGYETPSIGAEPDGDVTLEWYRSPRRTLSVSVSKEGYLHYAAIIGMSKHHGSVPFFDEVPDEVLRLIDRIQRND